MISCVLWEIVLITQNEFQERQRGGGDSTRGLLECLE